MKKKIETIEKFLIYKIKNKKKKYKNLKNNENFFDFGMDSLDYIKLIFEIENEYNVSINPKNYSKLISINKLKIHVKKLLI